MIFRFFIFSSFLLSFLACFVSSAELCYGCEKEIELTDDKITEVSKHVRNYLKTQYSKDELDKIVKIRSQTVSGIKTTVEFLTHNSESQKQKRCTMKYVKQPWIVDEPHILDFICKPHREKKQLLGEPKDVDSSENELLHKLGEVVTNTFDEIDEDTTKKVLVKILDAKKQLVNGIMYHMKIEIKNTNCPENQETNEKCLNEEIEPRKICNVTVHRSFADNSPLNAKLVNSECSSVEEPLLGSPVTVSANDKYIQEVAEFVMKHINMMSNSIYIKRIRNIIDAKTQLVSGTKVDLTIATANTDCVKNDKNRTVCNFLDQHPENSVCQVSVLEKDKHKKILNFHCDSQRFKRSAALGEEQEIDVNDTKIQGLKELIANELTQRANSLYKKTVVKIFKAKTQVISGSLTTVTVEVADTNCLKSENKALSECVSQSEQGRQICEITIREKPWLNKVEIPHSECHSVSSWQIKQKIIFFDHILYVLSVKKLTSSRNIIQKFAHFFEVDENDKHLNDFFKFIERENREYKNPDELKKRFRIFRANMKKAATLQEYEQGTGKYGATKFADLSAQEFKKYLGYNYNPDYVSPSLKSAIIPNISLPTSFDWRDHGAVTPVKNQGSCGSCWAFSVTGNIEGLYAIKNSELKSFSEQELVDCDKYDNGCNGGLFDTAYHAIEDLGGLELEQDYPYDGVKETCEIKTPEIQVSVSGGLNISRDENDMAKFLVANGPISIALNANAMQFYMGGVSHPFKFLCNPKNLDHGVLIVGYGIHKTKYTKKMLPYWLVKNSWGKSWGEQGYYMVYRGDGTCGVNQMPCTAILAD